MTISLAILGRAPIPGYAKTRLIPALGAAGAARVQEILLTRVVELARRWCHRPGREWRLWCAPDTDHPFLRALGEPEQLRRQPEGDLGARLDWIHRQTLAETDAVLLLGADAATMDLDHLDQAEAALQDAPAVLVPAEDGGYVLLGLGSKASDLFQEIPWGTDQVARITRERLRLRGWNFRELTLQWDVDTPDDWQRYLNWTQLHG